MNYTKMNYTNSYDKKIITWDYDNNNDYKGFMAQFTDDECKDMSDWLEREFDYDYSWAAFEDAKECIVIDYIKEMLIENIRTMTYYGTDKLLKAYYCLN